MNKQVQIYYESETVGRIACGLHMQQYPMQCMCSHQMAALFCIKWCGHLLKVQRQVKNPTPSIDVYLLHEQSCQISSQCCLKH